ncbi:unnamed protein product [Cuscuta europaea]|uniref:Glycosyl transferase, family 14 n=1 Tax=Cuscuta europaea TaxID=41803 RepID=A0A9P1DY04_CUSEU|nr:unnamed protein product [Cuscuta europaea]
MRSKGEKEESARDSISILAVVSIFTVFVVGVVIGLASSTHIDKYLNFQTQQPHTNTAFLGSGNNFVCEDCLSMESFIRPSTLNHGMKDEELFWRASLVPTKNEYPFQRVPKVAFMFLTRGALPMMPLWERFFYRQDKNKYGIYVHAPPGYEFNVANNSAFYNRQIKSQKVEWGSVSLVDAEKRLLANALLDFSNERFLLLSESCIPLHSFPTVYKYLTESHHSFVESYDDPSRYGRGRYNRRMNPNIKLPDWRKGSQWFELGRILAINIVSETKYYNLFKSYCHPSCYPDEHYIPTYLHMFYGPMNANRSVTYVDWSLGGPHPATYAAVNITEGFLEGIRYNDTSSCSYNSGKTQLCYLFARKFAPSALEPLLNISSKVMGF